MTKGKGKALTTKQKMFLKEYFKTGNGTRSAMKVYNCKNVASASALASETLASLKDVVRPMMEMKGLTLGRIIDVVNDGTDANKVISAMVVNKKGDGMKQANSMTKDFIEVPDHPTRLKAAEIAAKWLGISVQPQVLQQFNVYGSKVEKQQKDYGI